MFHSGTPYPPAVHHASDALLLSHAAGSLPAGLALAVATHLSLCPLCRERMMAAQDVGGALLDRMEPVDLESGALARALRGLDAAPPAPPPRKAPPAFAGLPPPLRAAVADLPDPQWRFLAPGIRQVDLMPFGRPGGAARLLRIAPGTTLPHHGHSGMELTVILHGSFTDELGRFRRGDIAEAEDDVIHQPIADSAEDCICLIATDSPLRFSGLIGRLMQPLIGL